MHEPLQRKATQQGVIMIETMVAILIFSVGILAIVGLQATMVKNTADSKFRSDASYIAQEVLGQMWADPANLATYVTATPTDISGRLPSGTLSIASPAAGQYTVTVTWLQPGPNQQTHNYTTTARITGN